jgi:type IX secretion system PorP/SprF family membrane protein
MLKRAWLLLMTFIASASCAAAQGLAAGPVYQLLLMNNPAMSGSEGAGILRLSYLNYYPGNSYNLNSAYLSYDSYIPALHGGAGIYLSEDYMGGIINDLRGGLSYAYFLQAGKNLYINAGLTASVFHRGYDFTNAVLPDQIDPLGGATLPSSEVLDATGKTVLDVGVGFLFSSGKVSGGLAVNHLAEPELSSSAISVQKLSRRYSFHISSALNLNGNGNLKIEPLVVAIQQGNYFSASGGAALESAHLAINAVLMADNGSNINCQSGFAVNFSIVSIYYNYLFNLKSGNSLLPLSLLHQVGLAFSLNNVEKRNAVKTINFPKL